MATPTEEHLYFRLFISHVEGDGPFIKICGHLDHQALLMVINLFEAARESMDRGEGSALPAAIREGSICAAKCAGVYYRVRVVNTSNLGSGFVFVNFIDYGNSGIMSLTALRFFDNYDPMFLQIQAQATEYYLARVMNPYGRWEEPYVLSFQTMLCNGDFPVTVELQSHALTIISIIYKGSDLSTHLLSVRCGVPIPIHEQEGLLLQIFTQSHQRNMQPTVGCESPVSAVYPQHIPLMTNQSIPSNTALSMPLHYHGPIPVGPSPIGPCVMVTNASNNAAQPQHGLPNRSALVSTPPPTPVSATKPASLNKSMNYKKKLLEVGSEHEVFVSFIEKGPELFSLRLVSDTHKMQHMNTVLNKMRHRSLTEPPMVGTVCLGLLSAHNIICRAIVVKIYGTQCKLFFVDLGNIEIVSHNDIYDIPEEFMTHTMFAMTFCLSGVQNLVRGAQLKETFKQLVNLKIMVLKVVPPEGPPLIQYGEMYMDDKNLLDVLVAHINAKLQFNKMDMLPLGSKHLVVVTYVDSCIKFFVQLSDKIDELNVVMEAVRVHCENSSPVGALPVGAACCARFADDNNWYRARVIEIKAYRKNKVVVKYVDYGNEQEVDVSYLRSINPDLISLPVQAVQCALKGFEDKPVTIKMSDLLEKLALEKTLTAHIAEIRSNTMVVSLANESVNPPVDITRKMNLLSQPIKIYSVKDATPVRRRAPEPLHSTESVSDLGTGSSLRVENSYMEDRRAPRGGNDELPQSSRIFRARDNKENLDSNGAGWQGDRFRGRPDRGHRRVLRENFVFPSTSTAFDEREEFAVAQAPPARRAGAGPAGQGGNGPADRGGCTDRRVLRENYAGPSTSTAFNEREEDAVAQAPPARRAGAGPADRGGRTDRRVLRENYVVPSTSTAFDDRGGAGPADRGGRTDSNQQDDWDQRAGRDNRPEGWDNRSGRHESWGNRNLKRNFRGDKPGRSTSTKSDDRKSDRSYKSNDGDRDQAGRAPTDRRPSRSNFTQVQYKELSEPVPLGTPFTEPALELGAQQEVSVTWIISPDSFYAQILSLQPQFLEMMNRIAETYKGVKSYSGSVPVGASVLARYPADGALYRATVVSVEPRSKFIVRYVDFGNKQLVDAKDIWQLDRPLMELPQMAVHCSLSGVAPTGGQWKVGPELDACFSAPRYRCVLLERRARTYRASLWRGAASVAGALAATRLATLAAQPPSGTFNDESIDLTILVGQRMLCRVTHVESFEEFYVQLDFDKALLVENAIANFDTSKLTPLNAEGAIVGVHCMVKHDGKLFRAILQDVSDAANIRAVLPDCGRRLTCALDHLMTLPTELSIYHYQSLQCRLKPYPAESEIRMTIEELKTKLTGYKCLIYINGLEGATLVSTLYEATSGARVPRCFPEAFDPEPPLCARAVLRGALGAAEVTHVTSLRDVYLRCASDAEQLTSLMDQLYAFYEKGTAEALTSFVVHGLCAAKSSDGNWYRGGVVSDQGTQALIQFIDYGKSEIIFKYAIKILDPRFYEPCALALVVSLGVVQLQDNAIDKFKEWSEEKEIQVTLAVGDGGWLATLLLDGVDLAMRLVNEKLAKPLAITEQEQRQVETATVEPISLPDGCQRAYICHIDTPEHFWLQMLDKVDKIDELQADLQANADSYADIESRHTGTLCIAKYITDDQWYRAEILDSNSDITTVRFIDYGNTDVLDNQPGLLKAIPGTLKNVERYAVKSSLIALPTGNGQWSQQASEYFSRLVGDLPAPVDVLIIVKAVTTYVDIFVNGQNLTEKLVSEGHASWSVKKVCGDLPSCQNLTDKLVSESHATWSVEYGDLPTCFTSRINSPSEFWIQLETATPELQAMDAAMAYAENYPELTDKEEGVICAAKYSEDGAWYRAQVIVDGSEGTEILFMDYGNVAIANELRSISEELKAIPALAKKCALQKPLNIKSWSRISQIKFNELAAERAIFNVQCIASGDISIVELYLEGKSVTEELVGLCDELPATERSSPEVCKNGVLTNESNEKAIVNKSDIAASPTSPKSGIDKSNIAYEELNVREAVRQDTNEPTNSEESMHKTDDTDKQLNSEVSVTESNAAGRPKIEPINSGDTQVNSVLGVTESDATEQGTTEPMESALNTKQDFNESVGYLPYHSFSKNKLFETNSDIMSDIDMDIFQDANNEQIPSGSEKSHLSGKDAIDADIGYVSADIEKGQALPTETVSSPEKPETDEKIVSKGLITTLDVPTKRHESTIEKPNVSATVLMVALKQSLGKIQLLSSEEPTLQSDVEEPTPSTDKPDEDNTVAP